jgi:hypothetical protein
MVWQKWRTIMKVLNAFSLNMVAHPATIETRPVSLQEAFRLVASGFESAVGHADTAAVFSSLLGVPVPMNRQTICLQPGETALVGQYSGPRLPEGATTLPEGATITWLLVTVGAAP